MCRQYKFRFQECGHVIKSFDWTFLYWHHISDSCQLEEVMIDRPQHCFQCLRQEKMPLEQRNPYSRIRLRNFSTADCSNWFDRIFAHHLKHSYGPRHFNPKNLRALWEFGVLPEEDRQYIEQVEERCDDWLWSVRDAMEDDQNPKIKDLEAMRKRFVDQRNIVLQLRYTHLSALAQRLEYDRLDEEQITVVNAEILRRTTSKVKALLTAVKKEELSECDDCPICHDNLLGLTKLNSPSDHVPVRVPCGHLFSRACILKWLEGDIPTCPSCRADSILSKILTRIGMLFGIILANCQVK